MILLQAAKATIQNFFELNQLINCSVISDEIIAVKEHENRRSRSLKLVLK